MRIPLLVLFGSLSLGGAYRIALSANGGTPFLQTVNGDGIAWSSPEYSRLIQLGSLVEVSARGIRIVGGCSRRALAGGSRGPLAATACNSSRRALCVTDEGLVLPSSPPTSAASPATAMVEGRPSALKDPVLRLLALSGACLAPDAGRGRVFFSSSHARPGNNTGGDGGMAMAQHSHRPPVNYTVTACDVLLGTYVLTLSEGVLSVYRQTFGPMAYLLVLISAAISVAAIASACGAIEEEGKGLLLFGFNALLSACVCMLVAGVWGVPFHCDSDMQHFWMTAAMCAAYSLLVFRAPRRATRACLIAASLHALDASICALYRTPETPYASILALVFAVRLWSRVFRVCHLLPGAGGLLPRGELCVCIAHLGLLVQAGVIPQFQHAEVRRLSRSLSFHSWLVTDHCSGGRTGPCTLWSRCTCPTASRGTRRGDARRGGRRGPAAAPWRCRGGT